MMMIAYNLGLIIVSIAIGNIYTEVSGWLTLGSGLIVFAFINLLIREISGREE